MSESDVKKCPKCDKDMEIGYLPGLLAGVLAEVFWSIKKSFEDFCLQM